MKSSIWRLASVGLLSLAIAGQVFAEGQGPGQDGHGGQGGHGGGNGGGQWQGRPQGNQGGQWQGHPQGNQGGQWQGRPQGNQGGQWQGRPQANQGQGRPQNNWNGQWQGRPSAGHDDHGPGRPSGGGSSWQGRPPSAPGNAWHGRPGGNWGPHPSNWRPGYVVDRVPSGYYRVPWRGSDYFFNDGYWYRPHGARYVVVAPPYGVRVRYLPSYAEQLWFGSMLYFLAAGTYYLFDNSSQTYEVVPPPPQVAQAPLPTGNPYDVIAYPMYGQSPQQQAQDHYECHTWAVGQSGFDPAMAGYAPSQQAVDTYRGALGSCLQGRGYSIN